MDIISTENIDLEQVADLCALGGKRKPPTPRDRAKFHVSNLLQSAHLIAKGQNVYHEYSDNGSVPTGIMSWGRIWEAAVDIYLADYALQHGGVYVSDVEQEEDGVVGSLDGLMVLPDLGMLVCECKLRFTLNHEIPLPHLQQIRAYCHLASTDLMCYVSGHLSSAPPTATARMVVARLTEQSIEECWQGIMHTKEHLLRCGCGPTNPTGEVDPREDTERP